MYPPAKQGACFASNASLIIFFSLEKVRQGDRGEEREEEERKGRTGWGRELQVGNEDIENKAKEEISTKRSQAK